MSFIHSILPKYPYIYFDENNKLQTKALNLIQCILRKIFGYYLETHLVNVCKKAYIITFNDEFTCSTAARQTLLKCLFKAHNLYQNQQNWVPAHEYQFQDHTAVVRAHYRIREQGRPQKNYIDATFFAIQLINKNVPDENTSVAFGISNRDGVLKIQQLFTPLYSDEEGKRVTKEHAKIINSLIGKILCDSKTLAEALLIEYSMFSSETVNREMKDVMHGLGWEDKPDSGRSCVLKREKCLNDKKLFPEMKGNSLAVTFAFDQNESN